MFTRPGLSARNTKFSPWNRVAYFATTIFTAALDIEYGAIVGRPKARVASRSPTPEERVITLAVPEAAVAFKSGRKALMVRTTPSTLVRIYATMSVRIKE